MRADWNFSWVGFTMEQIDYISVSSCSAESGIVEDWLHRDEKKVIMQI